MIADFDKICAFKDYAEALSLELLFGYQSKIPVDYKELDYYKMKFEDAMEKRTCLCGDPCNNGIGYIELAKKYFNSMNDMDLSYFTKKANRYYNQLKDYYHYLEDGSWLRES